jgi:hypothetical protein
MPRFTAIRIIVVWAMLAAVTWLAILALVHLVI